MEKCCLFGKEPLKKEQFREAFEVVETFLESSHHDLYLKKCTGCGALFLCEFQEFMGFGSDGDEMYSTYVQVVNRAHAKALIQMDRGGDIVRRGRPAIHWNANGSIIYYE